MAGNIHVNNYPWAHMAIALGLIPTAESFDLSAHGALQNASSGAQVKIFGGWY
jgi:hypothetical protein